MFKKKQVIKKAAKAKKVEPEVVKTKVVKKPVAPPVAPEAAKVVEKLDYEVVFVNGVKHKKFRRDDGTTDIEMFE